MWALIFNFIGSQGFYPRQGVQKILLDALFSWYESKSKRIIYWPTIHLTI